MKHPDMAATAAALIISASFATGARAQAVAVAPAESDWTFAANVSVVSEYRYRGLMQTNAKPALQGGFDISHSSGFYIGNWNSSISWLSDADPDISSNVEMDFYAGYVHTFANSATLDVGVLHYYYPGSFPGYFNDPDTTEAYVALGYGPATFKYSHALTDLFGAVDSRHSQYFDLSLAVPTGFWGLDLNAHVGHQRIRNMDDGSYTDWSVGFSKKFDRFTVSLGYVDTNADRDLYTNTHGRYMGRATALLSLSAEF